LDLSRYQSFSPLAISAPGVGQDQVTGLGLRGDDILVWLRSDAYTVQAAEAASQVPGSPAVYFPPLVTGQVFTLTEEMGYIWYTGLTRSLPRGWILSRRQRKGIVS
jgi:hypothetical protein